MFQVLALRQQRWRRVNARNVSFFTLYGGQLTFSTQLITLNYHGWFWFCNWLVDFSGPITEQSCITFDTVKNYSHKFPSSVNFKKFRTLSRIRRLLQWKILKYTSSILNLSETLTCWAIAFFSSLLARSRLDSLREKKKENIIPKNTVITIPDWPNFDDTN